MACRRSLLLLFSLLLPACGGRGSDLPRLPPATGEYRLAPGDQLRVITAGEDGLTGEFRVADDGRVSLPLLGALPATNRTPRGLQEDIATRLREAGLLRDPSVSVEVATTRPIYVLGEVNRPGQYPFQTGMTVVSAVAAAGGFTYRGISDYAGIVRLAEGSTQEGRAARRDLIQPGDVITIYERRF